jgi:hypothetical protein
LHLSSWDTNVAPDLIFRAARDRSISKKSTCVSRAFDAPLQALLDTHGNSQAGLRTDVLRNDKFEDYFLYQATGNRPPIPVALLFMQWTWGGEATSSGPQTWSAKPSSLLSPSLSLDSVPISKAPQILPTWSDWIQTLRGSLPNNPCPAPTPSPTPSPSPTLSPAPTPVTSSPPLRQRSTVPRSVLRELML